MQDQRCDVCGEPATQFYAVANCFTDGRPGSSTSTQLCDAHAAAHEQATARETLDSMLRGWRGMAAFARPEDVVDVVFDAPTEADAGQSATDLRQSFGGHAEVARWPDGWKVIWQLSASVPAIDQWQCEGWSQRVMEIARRGNCTLNGYALPAQRA